MYGTRLDTGTASTLGDTFQGDVEITTSPFHIGETNMANRLPKLAEIADNDNAHFWYDPRVVPADHPTYLVVRLEYTDHWGCGVPNKYHIEILAVGPKWPSKKRLQDALRDYEMTLEQFKEYELEGQLQLLVESGCAAHLWQSSGNNERKLIRAARKELQAIQCLFGFYMDRAHTCPL